MNPSSPFPALTDSENTQSTPVQSHNLDIVPVSASVLTNSTSKMEIETIFHTMLKQVGGIGELCRNNLMEAGSRLETLEDKSNLVNAALETLVNKDLDITNMLKCQANFNDFASQALSWLRKSYDYQQESFLTEKKRSLEWEQRINDEVRTSQKMSRDAFTRIDDLKSFCIRSQLLEDLLTKANTNIEVQESAINTLKLQSNSLQMRVTEIESLTNKLDAKINKAEDSLLVLEERMRETRKNVDEIPKLKEDIKTVMRDSLIADEDVSKLKGSIHNLSEKIDKSTNKKLSKAEKSALNTLETETVKIDERLKSVEFTLSMRSSLKISLEDSRRK